MKPDSIRIIIVEDNVDLREGLSSYLSMLGYHVTEAGSGRDFYRALDQGDFDVAVIDIGLPDQSGLVLAEYLRGNTAATGIIILTAHDSDEHQAQGYEAGADLYLTKPVSSKVLASAIARLAARLNRTPVSPAAQLPAQSWLIDGRGWTLYSPTANAILLTGPEIELLKLLSYAAGTPVSRAQLIERLYPANNDDCSSRALDALVRRLRHKLSFHHVGSSPLKSIYGVGFCFIEMIKIK